MVWYYCPLRNTKIAQAVEIKELFINHYYGLSDVIIYRWTQATEIIGTN